MAIVGVLTAVEGPGDFVVGFETPGRVGLVLEVFGELVVSRAAVGGRAVVGVCAGDADRVDVATAEIEPDQLGGRL